MGHGPPTARINKKKVIGPMQKHNPQPTQTKHNTHRKHHRLFFLPQSQPSQITIDRNWETETLIIATLTIDRNWETEKHHRVSSSFHARTGRQKLRNIIAYLLPSLIKLLQTLLHRHTLLLPTNRFVHSTFCFVIRRTLATSVFHGFLCFWFIDWKCCCWINLIYNYIFVC